MMGALEHPMLPITLDQRTPRGRGRAHGELWRAEIAELCSIREAMTLRTRNFRSSAAMLAAAAGHVAILSEHAPDLADELLGIAEGAAQSPERIVILNHYTDFRDLSGSPVPDDEGCTAIYFNGTSGPVLGQTWDMHGSTESFVRMLRIAPADSDEEVVCLTLTGCLGVAGLSHRGVAITVNNLSTTDGRIGVIWPAVVRSLLSAPDAVAAHAKLLALPLGGGRNFMIADGNAFFGVECSAELKVLTQLGPKAAHIHTNHCFDPVLRRRERVAATSTSFDRMNIATTLYAQQRPKTVCDLKRLLASHDAYPRSICSHADELPGGASSRTCARLAMQLRDGGMWAARGCSRTGPWLPLRVERYAAAGTAG